MGGALFKVETVWDAVAKRHDRAMVAVCSKCPRRAIVADNGGKARPDVYFADKFRAKGWRIAPRAGAHVCPQCVVGIKSKPPASALPLKPAQKRAAFCRIAGVPRAADSPVPKTPKEAAMTKPAPGKTPALSVVADAPRQPTHADKHKIREALDAAYLRNRGMYAGNGSDEALAMSLNVPRAWVTHEREDAYGPDACEDDGKDDAALAKIAAQCGRLAEEAFGLAEKYEALGKDVSAMRAKLAKRGVA